MNKEDVKNLTDYTFQGRLVRAIAIYAVGPKMNIWPHENMDDIGNGPGKPRFVDDAVAAQLQLARQRVSESSDADREYLPIMEYCNIHQIKPHRLIDAYEQLHPPTPYQALLRQLATTHKLKYEECELKSTGGPWQFSAIMHGEAESAMREVCQQWSARGSSDEEKEETRSKLILKLMQKGIESLL